MSLCNTFRSFTIVLLIELAVIQSQVSAFTIKRIQGINNSADLIESESALHTKSDLTPNDVKVIDIKNDGMHKIVPIVTTAKTEDIKKSVAVREKVSSQSSTVSSSKSEEEDETVTGSVLTSSLTAGVSKSNSEIKKTSSNTPDVQQITLSQATRSTTKGNYTTSGINTSTSLPLQAEATNVTIGIEVTEVLSELTIKEVQSKNNTETNSTSSTMEPTELKKTITASTSASKAKIDDITSETTPTTTLITKRSTKSETSITRNTDTADAGKKTSKETVRTTPLMNETEKSTEPLTSDNSSVTVIPYWKKYTMIERRRVNKTTEKDILTSTEKEEELVPAGTAQSSVSLETAFSISSDIPSIEKLKNDLRRTNKFQITENPRDFDLSSSVTSSQTGTSTVSTETNDTTKRIEVVSSKRAGFLDLSSRPTNVAETITTGITETTRGVVETTMGITTTTVVPELRTTLKEKIREKINKKDSGTESQSQLAEDAINEELMKEEMLNDNVENAKRYREERFDVDGVKTSAASINTLAALSQTEKQISQESSSEDKLSVKPISPDKKSALYTVSPNYKPLKKIDVSPPKPFVRNPDDNSWRNESLSSLGIVFKAKNSSKPFTQVLKNKTEIEWNNLLEKYNKDIEPELRERLVKISEIRKRKKKIDKFGETVYSDYEESNSSSESTGILNGDFPENVMLPIAEITPVKPITTDIIQEILKLTTTQRVYINTETEMTPIIKPKKQYNIESYDAEEEDADYVTLPNIEIKKFANNSKTGEKQRIFLEKPVLQFLPERKPTIQYFPPRTTQKVQHINEYDDLQNKLNQFVIKSTSKNVIPISYPTTPTYPKQKLELSREKNIVIQSDSIIPRAQKPLDINKNIYVTHPAEIEQSAYDGNFNKGSYVIKHFRDFLNEAAKDSDDDRNLPLYVTETPLRGVTTNNLIKSNNKVKPPADYYDYEAQFRKDVLERFVENFNQNSDRFKVDFPILYNTSVVHSKLAENGKVQASSSAFVKRLYDSEKVKPVDYAAKPYDPNCDRTVELSPAYELHYYVPEEEEKEEVDPKSIKLPYPFKL